MKKWMIIGGTVLALGGGLLVYRQMTSKPEGPTYAPTTARRERLEVSILATGTVQPENRLEIKPPIAGRIEEVLVTEGRRVRKGQILAWMSSSERAALLDAASAKGPEELKQWEEMYKATPILAPINGTIILRNVEAGQAFATTDAILVMSDRLTVKAQVDETDIAVIRVKQNAKIVLDAYPGKTIPGRVDQIAYEAKTVNNVTTYLIDVLPLDAPSTLRSGMTANVTFAVAEKDDALVVPTDAIKAKDGVSSVMVPGAEPKAPPIEREIETGLTDGKRTEVLSGLTEGDTVLVPQFKLNGVKKQANPFAPPAPGKGKRKPAGPGA